MTTGSLADFLGRYQRGIEVGVAGAIPDELLGVREAFRRFFQDGLGRPVAVAVVPQEPDRLDRSLRGLAGSDLEAVASARADAERMAERLGAHYQFYVGLDVGVQAIDLPEGTRYLLRSWSAVLGPPGLAYGASGSLELPARWLDRAGESAGPGGAPKPPTLPGTRRAGGLVASLTRGLETRRAAVAQATLHALSTLFYGILDAHAGTAR